MTNAYGQRTIIQSETRYNHVASLRLTVEISVIELLDKLTISCPNWYCDTQMKYMLVTDQ